MATTGIRPRHARRCASRPKNGGGKCNCRPTYEARVWSKRAGPDGKGGMISKSFPTYAAAKGWRSDAMHAAERGRLQRPTRQTLYEAAVELVEGMRDGSIRSKRKRPYKPSVIRSYERKLGLTPECRERAPERLLERHGDLKLTDVTHHTLQPFCERLLSAGYSAATVHNTLDPWRVVFRVARSGGVVGYDPFELLDLPDRREDARPRRIAQPDEAAALLAALDDEYRPVWATAFYSGLRRGELRALQALDIDFDTGVLRVRRGWDDEEGEQDGKTDNAARDVPILGLLRPVLRDHLMRTGRRGADLVFGRTAKEAFVPTTVRREALAAWADTNLEPLTLHECRHTFASLLIAAGVDLLQVAVYMGHADTKTTTKIYGHLLADARERAVKRVDAFLAAQPGGLRAVD